MMKGVLVIIIANTPFLSGKKVSIGCNYSFHLLGIFTLYPGGLKKHLYLRKGWGSNIMNC